MGQHCSSYQRGKQVCDDGFPVGYPASSVCSGIGCPACGTGNNKLPPCQDEDIHPRWLKDNGLPLLYKGPPCNE